MDPLSVAASIIAVLQVTNEIAKYLKDVKDAPKERQRYAEEASNIESLLRDLSSRLLRSSGNEPWFSAVQILNVEGGILDQFHRELKDLKAKLLVRGGVKKLGDTLLWKFKKEEIASMMMKMERLSTNIKIALSSDQFELSLATKDDTSFIKESIQEQKTRQLRDQIITWISPLDFSAQQADLLSRRQEGTGEWFIRSPEFSKWIREPKETLFCPGIPGAGKTMIAVAIVDYLARHLQSDNVGLAYVFCNYKATEDQTLPKLQASILKQLIQTQPTLINQTRLPELYSRRKPSLDDNQIDGILQSVISYYPTTYIVVDALDECTDKGKVRSRFIASLRDLKNKADVRLLFTSRPYPDVSDMFRGVSKLEIGARSEDIQQFVGGQIHRFPQWIQDDRELLDQIMDKIVTAVDKMFLLARLYIDSLLDTNTKKELKSTLTTLKKGPEALQGAYDEALKRIDGQSSRKVNLAKRLISWVTYARRPLTTVELQYALAIEIGTDKLDEDNIIPNLDAAISLCAGLIGVDRESGIVRLVHETTQEYFQQNLKSWNPSAEEEIALSCLTYISFAALRHGMPEGNSERRRLRIGYPFLSYAARFWGDHVSPVQESSIEPIFKFLRDVDLHYFVWRPTFTQKPLATLQQKVSWLLSTSNETFELWPWQSASLNLLARLGFFRLFEQHLQKLQNDSTTLVNAIDKFGRTPLATAIYRGHTCLVKLLTQRNDVDVNLSFKDYRSQTALHLAVKLKHEEIVRLLLLREDLDVNVRNYNDQTPLHIAVGNAYEALVTLLLTRKHLDTNVRDYGLKTALHRAVDSQNETIVRLLLGQESTNTNLGDRHGRTPLSYAAEAGNMELVRVLIEEGNADLNAEDWNECTPLFYATKNNHEGVIRLLSPG